MSRRSSRLAGLPADVEMSCGDNHKGQVNTKKRKNTSSSGGASKKPRGTRGILSEILDMPYDIVVEIFSQLEPVDLLTLMRTSKDLRAFFTNRQNKLVWKAARRNLPVDMPECPDDLSEPRYADLAFGTFCDNCLEESTRLHICWAAGLKVCPWPCIRRLFVSGRPQWASSELTPYIPFIESMDQGYGGRMVRVVSYLRDTERQYNEAKANGSDAVDDMVKAHKARFLYSQACITWLEAYREHLAQERAALLESRKSVFLERLRVLGWGEEIDKLNEYCLNRLKKVPELVEICETELTEEGISKVMETLVEHMVWVKKTRIESERYNLLHTRVPPLQDVIKTYISSLPVSVGREVPVFADFFRHPYIDNLINNTPEEDFMASGLESLRDALPRIVNEVRSTIHDKVVALAAEGYAGSEDKFDPKKTLDLATTMFSCGDCRYGGWGFEYSSDTIRYSDVMFHRCVNVTASQLHVDEWWNKRVRGPEKDVDFAQLDRIMNEADWNRYGQIKFNTKTKGILSDVVALAGLDPKTATTAEMDALDPIIECVTCNSPSQGRATMKWSTVHVHHTLYHVQGYDRPPPLDMKLEVLGKDDAQIARERMEENLLRQRSAKMHNNTMTCAHCILRVGGSVVEMKKHVRSGHGILNPTDDDVVLVRNWGILHYLFRMWPPREE